jgi:hypothetical protein
MRLTPDCPDPNVPPAVVQVRVRPQPDCDPPLPVKSPVFTDPQEGTPGLPPPRFPRDLELLNQEKSFSCAVDYEPYLLLDAAGDYLHPTEGYIDYPIPDGPDVTVEENLFSRTFRWGIRWGVDELELLESEENNLYIAQQASQAGLINALTSGDTTYFVDLGIRPSLIPLFFDEWERLQGEINEAVNARGTLLLFCQWYSTTRSVECELAPLGVIPEATSLAGAASSSVSQEDADERAEYELLGQLDCRIGNVELTRSCEDAYLVAYAPLSPGHPCFPSLIPSVTIPANTFFADTQEEADELAAVDAMTKLFCPYPNTEQTIDCLTSPPDLVGGDPEDYASYGLVSLGTVVVPCGTFVETSLAAANDKALISAQLQLDCRFEADCEATCCCYPIPPAVDPVGEDPPPTDEERFREGDITFSGDPSSPGCATEVMDNPRTGTTCEGSQVGCKFRINHIDEEGECETRVVDEPPSQLSVAESRISYADARDRACAQAMLLLVCEHTNPTISYAYCPGRATPLQSGVAPEGTISATNMADAVTLAFIYARSLTFCPEMEQVCAHGVTYDKEGGFVTVADGCLFENRTEQAAERKSYCHKADNRLDGMTGDPAEFPMEVGQVLSVKVKTDFAGRVACDFSDPDKNLPVALAGAVTLHVGSNTEFSDPKKGVYFYRLGELTADGFVATMTCSHIFHEKDVPKGRYTLRFDKGKQRMYVTKGSVAFSKPVTVDFM